MTRRNVLTAIQQKLDQIINRLSDANAVKSFLNDLLVTGKNTINLSNNLSEMPPIPMNCQSHTGLDRDHDSVQAALALVGEPVNQRARARAYVPLQTFLRVYLATSMRNYLSPKYLWTTVLLQRQSAEEELESNDAHALHAPVPLSRRDLSQLLRETLDRLQEWTEAVSQYLPDPQSHPGVQIALIPLLSLVRTGALGSEQTGLAEIPEFLRNEAREIIWFLRQAILPTVRFLKQFSLVVPIVRANGQSKSEAPAIQSFHTKDLRTRRCLQNV